ncbi:MAG TPA: UxaA family hydrolase, partial [Bryobacteraceae bacterium]|nr:UxaA family hydrolase [Bryobacteraceae bacterium]
MSTLLGIHPAPSAENVVVRLHPSDNVAVVRVPLSVGTEVRVGGLEFAAKDNVPPGHKVALKTIRAGENVIRYGQRIGRAKRDIAVGEHIHTHNLGFEELE